MAHETPAAVVEVCESASASPASFAASSGPASASAAASKHLSEGDAALLLLHAEAIALHAPPRRKRQGEARPLPVLKAQV